MPDVAATTGSGPTKRGVITTNRMSLASVHSGKDLRMRKSRSPGHNISALLSAMVISLLPT
jgi:hypothetical protein